MNDATEKPRRRRWAFSLRTLMVFVLIVAVLIGWRTNKAYNQRQAVAKIRAAKGAITYDFQNFPPGTPAATRRAAKAAGPDWLRQWIGNEYFQEVIGVALRDPVDSETLKVIASFDRLEAIQIGEPLKAGVGLDHLTGLTRLKRVQLCGPAVNDAWLAHLARCRDIEVIELNTPDISDEGVKQLVSLNKLVVFALYGAPDVTDDSISLVVSKWPALKTLNLTLTGITDRSLKSIGQCLSLKQLALTQSKLTDQGIANLKALTGLSALNLDGTGMTDQGLPSLSEMTALRQLSIEETRVSGIGFKNLGKLQLLSMLAVDGSDFSDAGMPFLVSLARLQTISLERTKVSDAGLLPLQAAPGLAKIFTGGSSVTDSGLAELQKRNPRIKSISNRVSPATTILRGNSTN